jgi:hypothetical protein
MTQQPPSGPGPLHYRGFTMTLWHTTLDNTPLDEWSARCTDLYLTTHNTQQETDIHDPAWIRPRNPSKRAAADPHLRPRGHRDWPSFLLWSALVLSSLSSTVLTSQQFRRFSPSTAVKDQALLPVCYTKRHFGMTVYRTGQRLSSFKLWCNLLGVYLLLLLLLLLFVITFIQGIYNYIPETTNHFSRV